MQPPLWRITTRKVRPVRLYIDDIEEILEFFARHGCTANLATAHYPTIGVRQLGDVYQKPIKEFIIEASHPEGELTLRAAIERQERRVTRLDVRNNDNVAIRGIEEQLLDLLKTRRHPLSSKPFIYVSIGLGIVLGSIGIAADNMDLGFDAWYVVMIMGFLLLIVLLTRDLAYSVIVPEERSKEPGFISRNRDELMKYVIAALLGGVVTYVVTVLSG